MPKYYFSLKYKDIMVGGEAGESEERCREKMVKNTRSKENQPARE